MFEKLFNLLASLEQKLHEREKQKLINCLKGQTDTSWLRSKATNQSIGRK